MSAHTPGPWAKGDNAMRGPAKRDWYAVQHVFNQEPFEGVLENEWGVYPPPGNAGPVCIASDEANARLIAAAPELLAALDGLMASESRGRIMPIGKEWDAARAAIAKARGAK